MQRRELFKSLASVGVLLFAGIKPNNKQTNKTPKIILAPGTYIFREPIMVNSDGTINLTNCTITPSSAEYAAITVLA